MQRNVSELPARASTPHLDIAGPIADAAWVILCPLLAFFALQAAWRWSGLSDFTLYAVLFALIVTGHHMPGWLRAFGEPAVYDRHKARLWVSAVAVPAMVIVPTVYGLGALALCVAAGFDLWHVSMQQHGFGRIYAAKRGEIDRRSARVDLACCLVGYATVVAWSDSWMHGLAAAFRRAGLPVFDFVSLQAWSLVRWTLLAASVALLAAYLASSFSAWRAHGRVVWRKHFLHAVTFAVLAASYQDPSWYRAQSTQNLFHAAQYFFLVWIYGHFSVLRDPTRPRAFYRALFARRRGMLLFALVVGVYGVGAWFLAGSGYRLKGWSEERGAQVLGSIGIASLLLHYYVDSFIWKVRTPEVRNTLGIAGEAVSGATLPELARSRTQLAGALHAVGYFGVPMLAVALLGASGRSNDPAAELRSMALEARLFPGSAAARYENGMAAARAGHSETARAELIAAQELSPSTEGPAVALADLARARGDFAEETTFLQAAVRAASREPNLHYRLGISGLERGDLDRAERELREVIRLDPEYAGAWLGLGSVYRRRSRPDLALEHVRTAHELAPEDADTLCHFAGALAAAGKSAEALEALAVHLRRHPEDHAVREFDQALRARL